MAAIPLGLVTEKGIVYLCGVGGSGGYPAVHKRNLRTGVAIGSGAFITSAALWFDPGFSYNSHFAIGGGKLGIAAWNGSTSTTIEVYTLLTGVLDGTITISSSYGPCDLQTDQDGNFYIVWAASAGVPNRLSKYSSARALASGFPVTGSTALYGVAYDRLNAKLMICGSTVTGVAAASVALIGSDGSVTSTGSPSGITTINSIRPDGRGNFRLGYSGNVKSITSAYVVNWTTAVANFSGYKISSTGVDSAKGTGGSQRVIRGIYVAGGDVGAFDSVGAVVVNSGSGALSPIAPIVWSAQNGLYLYFADGVSTKKYNIATNTMETWSASAGTFPVNAGNYPRLIATYRGRTTLAGISTDPTNWFMPKQGDPTNFDYGATPVTEQIAVAGNNALAGQMQDIITSLLPFTDDCMLFGGDHTIWQMAGDPAAGGRLDLVSDQVGMAWGRPWCKAPDGSAFFFSSRNSVYQIAPQAKPQKISQQINSVLASINLNTSLVRMAWDDREQGFYLWSTPIVAGGTAVNFFYDARSSAWFQDAYANTNHQPKAVDIYDADLPSDRCILIGGRDGYIRKLSTSATADDGSAISSWVYLGPLTGLGKEGIEGLLIKELQGTLDSVYGGVTWDVYVGKSAQEAALSSSILSGSFVAGRSRSQWIRRHGHALYVKLSHSTISEHWALEELRAVVESTGATRQRTF